MDERNVSHPVIRHFPLPAMVAMEDVSDAVSCLLCSDSVRTLLITGKRGTGKSIAARGISGLAPKKSIVEIPSNVTREQLFGTIDIEAAIQNGKRRTADSIMDRADGNILIADNANLLPSDMLQHLINCVSDGFVRAEINGMSIDSRCDTVLICTMDPEEGDLNEHILDRFDMCVFTDSVEDEESRKKIIRNNILFEKDPISFMSDYKNDELQIGIRIGKAREVKVSVSDEHMALISRICSEMHVEGHRGDLSVLNVSRALSALDGKDRVGVEEIKRSVNLCLMHRRRESPSPDNAPPPKEKDDDNNEDQQQSEDKQEGSDNDDADTEQSCYHNTGDTDSENEGGSKGPQEEKVFSIGEEFDVGDYIPPESNFNRNKKHGKRELSTSDDKTGRVIGYRIPNGKVEDVALCASIRVAAPYQITRKHSGLKISIKKEDLREKMRINCKGTHILFVVDGSGSVGAHNRMVAVKGAILSMLNDAYKRRDQIGLVVFKNEEAETLLPMTKSVLTAFKCLREMPTGGRTPLLSGLRTGYEILRKEAEMGNEPVLVILTDGRGNVGMCGDKPTTEENENTYRIMRESGMRKIVVDTERGLICFGKALALSKKIDAEYLRLEDLNAENLTNSIRSAMGCFE